MPHTAEAFASGSIDIAHVDRLASCKSPERAEAFAAAEAVLAASAREDSFEVFVRTVDYFEQQVDPDPDGTEADRDAKRRAHSSKMLNAMGKIDAVLDPVGWSVFDTVLHQIDKELFEADWAAVGAEHGDAACLAMLAIEGHIRRMVFDPDGICVDCGRKQRFFAGALREMIESRDRHCTGPGCDVPWWDCDIDHIIDWQHHGHTNGDLKCRWHHQHNPSYTITSDPTTGRTNWHKRET